MAIERIDPGQFRTPFLIERNSGTTDAMGGQVDDWQRVATIWGGLESQRADDPVRAGDAEQRIRANIVVRADPRLVEDMRLIGAGRTWRIGTVHDPDGTGRYLRCAVVTEVVA